MSKAVPLSLILTNNGNSDLSLNDKSLDGTTWTSPGLPSSIPVSDGIANIGTKGSETPYNGSFSYTPDGGSTLLTIDFSVEDASSASFKSSKSGPEADNWTIIKQADPAGNQWLVSITYYLAS